MVASDSSNALDAPMGTRAALLAAGFHLFGLQGFSATSTRQIAEHAGTNLASIAYHFGSKEGLRLACGDEFMRQMKGAIGAAESPVPITISVARQKLEAIVRAFVNFLVGSHQADDLVAFMLREVTSGGPVLDNAYETMIAPKHKELCHLWATVTGQDPDSETVRLAVFAFVGQVLYFRIGSNVVARRLGWSEYDATSAGKIADLLVANLQKILSNGEPT